MHANSEKTLNPNFLEYFSWEHQCKLSWHIQGITDFIQNSLGCTNVKQKIIYEIIAILDFTHKQAWVYYECSPLKSIL